MVDRGLKSFGFSGLGKGKNHRDFLTLYHCLPSATVLTLSVLFVLDTN
jgi:hypothetical protein